MTFYAQLPLFLFIFLSVARSQKVAIIGEGIGGSFTAKYLADYDEDCRLEDITIFEAVPIEGPVSVDDASDRGWQGSRITSLKLKDGTNIELGASIAHNGFTLVLDMIRDDPDNLEISAPFATGLDEDDTERSMGIYVGHKQWAFRTWSGWKLLNKLTLVLRYNYDLVKIAKITSQAEAAFVSLLPELLSSTEKGTFFQSPEQIWNRLGLLKAVMTPFSKLLDAAKIYAELPYWRSFLPFQGSLRLELLTAINLVNYNQDIDEINGLVGLGSFSASGGSLFSIKGGNHAVIRSAVRQAQTVRSKRNCSGLVTQIPKKVTHVIGDFSGFSLFSEGENLGDFDVVVLAAPLHQARIDFKVKSQFDAAVLQSMPLGGLIDTEEPTPEEHEGHETIPGYLPEAAQRPYTQVVTTVVSKGELQGEVLGLGSTEKPPRSIFFSSAGKASLHNITAITRIHPSGIYKIFSNDALTEDVKKTLFGPAVFTEYIKSWGGPHGGATPAYQGKGESTEFLLYDGALGLEGHTTSGALYYPSAFELSSLACMEISAVGAKAVSKLIAKRFGWIHEDGASKGHDEL
mmetsp:Transcript_6088/g.7873  ORF Transcript_6088/g.7873 Transcript_6088/m.7873 type:complete len:573 (+) Transcript_6088:112-1830(+)